MPINKGYLTKITAERARRERPDFIAPGTTNEVQKALVGKPLEKVVRSAPVIQGEVQAPQSTKVIKLDGGRISIVDAIDLHLLPKKNRAVDSNLSGSIILSKNLLKRFTVK